jgi:hypothetical protein
MPTEFITENSNEIRYQCEICKDVFDDLESAEECFEECDFMVGCYMDSHNISREEAIEMFRMERI